jgi:hypothetical protein
MQNDIYEELDGSYTINLNGGEISIRGNMNAYELADEMNDACIEFSGDAWIPTFEKVANMLRQQADQIAELEKCLIVEQEHNMMLEEQSEPIAIVNTNCENNIQWNTLKPQSYNGYFLYTTPQTKPLSDEEIIELYAKVDGGGIIKFARAVEAKVRGEK